jgi:hypothetical protein
MRLRRGDAMLDGMLVEESEDASRIEVAPIVSPRFICSAFSRSSVASGTLPTVAVCAYVS